MQRMSVDFPDPEGPQTTILSPRFTIMSMSRSTWKAPYHLFILVISIATSSKTCMWRRSISRPMPGSSFTSAMSASLTMIGPQPPLQMHRVARHAETEDEENRPDEHEQFPIDALPVTRCPDGVGQPHRVQKADEHHQRRILEQADKGVDDTRNRDLERLRHDDQPL